MITPISTLHDELISRV